MAPSRRKGAGKSASAAASRRKWNVGDLVLAKVKGYPAWPATVSEPKKWGFPADRKKSLVHFFGTQQIAFCNPADVEEFTEEKKTSLLGKRHGKGADFVRAVNEIIDCFEKLKKQDQASVGNGNEDTVNENELEESSTNSPKEYDPSFGDELSGSGATNGLMPLTEAAAAAAEDALHNVDMQLEEANSDLVSTKTSVTNTFSTRSKMDVSSIRNSTAPRSVSARRLRSTSRIDASRPQNTRLPSISNTGSSRFSNAGALYDSSLRRSKRVLKSSDESEGCDVNSPAFVSNESTEEDDSEIMTVDSDTPCLNDGSTVESQRKSFEVEPASQNNGRDEELNVNPVFRMNTAFVNKKGKPNLKQHCDEAVVVSNSNVVSECISITPNSCDKFSEVYARDDGDEHLPLVKRARVRMGRLSPVVGENGPLLSKDVVMLQVSENHAMQQSGLLSYKFENTGFVDSIHLEDPTNLSLLHASPAKKSQLWEARMNLTDGEAVLPPSKRLHRALEAMSANVAEDSQRVSASSRRTSTPSFKEHSSLLEYSKLSMEANVLFEMHSEQIENHDICSVTSEVCEITKKCMPEIDSKTLVVIPGCRGVSDCVNACFDKTNFECCDDPCEHLDDATVKCPKMSLLIEPPKNHDAKHQIVKSNSPKTGEFFTHLENNTPCFIVSPTNGCKIECLKLNEVSKTSGSGISQISSDKEFSDGLLYRGADFKEDYTGGAGDKAPSTKCPLLPGNNQYDLRSELVRETSSLSKDSNVSTARHHGYLLNALSTFHDPREREMSVTRLPFSLTDGIDFIARATLHSSSTCNSFVPDKNNETESNNSCSPEFHLFPETTNLCGKSSIKSEAISSFEAIIRTLSRTKESIGRATKIAIESAKSGFANKVVEMLAQYLERESNPHKKVDLFFLVDSITQCSRGIKGDGGIYPSVIQTFLRRLLLAAAPPSSSLENHKQCLKVLRVWQERKILPEPIIRRHIRELDTLCFSFTTGGSRRPLRNERAFDDPVREMEGMLVDEYGSNSSFQLPGFRMPPMLRDDDGGSDSDGESFEAVTPERDCFENFYGEKVHIPAIEKRSHILEDVDGELEMEDVSPPCSEADITSTNYVAGDFRNDSNLLSDRHDGEPFTSQQPKVVPLKQSPLRRSPKYPSSSNPLQTQCFHRGSLDSVSNGANSNIYTSSQNRERNLPGPMLKHPVLPRNQSNTLESACHLSHLSAQGSNRIQSADSTFNNGIHLQPPHPAPSNQFSYVQERQFQSRRDIPPPSHPSRLHSRNAENENSYRDRGRNKFVRSDSIGECWRPPLPSHSGPCYHNGSSVAHSPLPYSGPPREPSLNNNRWNVPPWPTNHRQFNPYRPPFDAPIPVANRGHNAWRPR